MVSTDSQPGMAERITHVFPDLTGVQSNVSVFK